MSYMEVVFRNVQNRFGAYSRQRSPVAPWVSHQLIREPTFGTVNHAHTTFTPQVGCACDPHSDGHKGIESPGDSNGKPPVNVAASFHTPVIVLVATGGQQSCAVRTQRGKVNTNNCTQVHIRRLKVFTNNLLKNPELTMKYSKTLCYVSKHLQLLSSATVHGEKIACFIYMVNISQQCKAGGLSFNLGCTHDAAGAFINTAQGINVTCPWDLQNTVSCPSWDLILSNNPWLFDLFYGHILGKAIRSKSSTMKLI